MASSIASACNGPFARGPFGQNIFLESGSIAPGLPLLFTPFLQMTAQRAQCHFLQVLLPWPAGSNVSNATAREPTSRFDNRMPVERLSNGLSQSLANLLVASDTRGHCAQCAADDIPPQRNAVGSGAISGQTRKRIAEFECA